MAEAQAALRPIAFDLVGLVERCQEVLDYPALYPKEGAMVEDRLP